MHAGPVNVSMRPARSGVPEIDKLFRKVRKQGGRIERGGAHWKVWGPQGQGPISVNSSMSKVTAIRNIRSKLRRIGFEL